MSVRNIVITIDLWSKNVLLAAQYFSVHEMNLTRSVRQ